MSETADWAEGLAHEQLEEQTQRHLAAAAQAASGADAAHEQRVEAAQQ